MPPTCGSHLLPWLLLGVACSSGETGDAPHVSTSSAGAATAGSATSGAASGGRSGSGGGSSESGGAVVARGGQSGSAGGEVASGGVETASFSVQPASLLWTAVRHYSGPTPSGRTSGPAEPPQKQLTIHNESGRALTVSVRLTGADASRFELITPAEQEVAAEGDAVVSLRFSTDDTALGAAPAQDDGATALEAALELGTATPQASVRSYALVLTYAELEPTFGQILRAFPQWTTRLPSWLPDDANPNPGATLPGIVAGTDEVAAASFERLDAKKPVTLRPLARFSPPGPVPFGWYEPGKPANRSTIATLAEAKDPQSNDKSRLLEPPLASGSPTFEPTVARFGIWMEPAGVGLLASEDAACFDGQHRVRAWSLRDAHGDLLEGSFLIGAEEAKNGDYQDYVFVLDNVKATP